jgi:hypothetical protein
MREPPMRETSVRIALLAGISLAAFGGGCASYATYPAQPRNIAINDPNFVAMEEVMMVGLRHVVNKYPPGGRQTSFDAAAPAPASGEVEEPKLALNLPQGVRPRVYERVARAMGHGTVPLTPEVSHLPIYHVTHVRVRGDMAQINISRPVTDLPPSPTGEAVMQEIKLQLRGGLSPWKVVTTREWDPGIAELPPLNYYRPQGEPEFAQSRPAPAVEGTYRPRANVTEPRE